LNALDDPLVPQQLWEPVREICQTHPRHAFILLKHGGHLGFLEGSTPFNPRSITWLDRLILQLAEAVTAAGQTHDDHPTSSSKSTAASF
jgi:predicted alpha/beta-fold hydrolase